MAEDPYQTEQPSTESRARIRAKAVDFFCKGVRRGTTPRARDVPDNPMSEMQVPTADSGRTGGTMGAQGTLRIGTFNAGSLGVGKQQDLLTLIAREHYDILFVVDAQLSDLQKRMFRRHIKEELGPDFATVYIKGDGGEGGRVGGQVAVINTRSVTSIKVVGHDVREAVTRYELTMGGVEVTVLATYWPCENKSNSSMWMELGGESAIDNIKADLAESIRYAKSCSREVVCLGDFNSDVNGADDRGVAEFMASHGLQRGRKCPLLPSYGSGGRVSRIDDVYTSLQVVDDGIDGLDHVEGQHSVVWADVIVRETCTQKAGLFFLGKDLPLSSPAVCEEYASRMGRWGRAYDGGDFVGDLQRMSVITTHDLVTTSKRARWREQWSPDMQAFQAALRALISMKRRMEGLHRYKKWAPTEFDHRVGGILSGWESQLKRTAGKGEQAKERLTLWMTDPAFYMFLSKGRWRLPYAIALKI
jgi:hypothetical protein